MSQCVPSWDVDDNPDHNSNVGRLKINLRASSNSMFPNDVPKYVNSSTSSFSFLECIELYNV